MSKKKKKGKNWGAAGVAETLCYESAEKKEGFRGKLRAAYWEDPRREKREGISKRRSSKHRRGYLPKPIFHGPFHSLKKKKV